MSDSNLSDKIAESITNILKKTKVFEKIDEIQFYIGSFFLHLWTFKTPIIN
jgi:hypothetical protein